MFFIRYCWTLPLKVQLAIGIALLAALASAHGSNAQADEFAALHQARCLQQPGLPAAELCALRTVQLASQLHGVEFGDQVAEALR
ncbi:hypothetical protein ACN9MZ_20075 [Pseudoduganella sp. S-14]|jgi:hypothetical protein|uniref:hypothetical protein n=1 Tax=Pseudoduganella sp. S-14 TaxID=3404065 RepID=UPI003CF72B4C